MRDDNIIVHALRFRGDGNIIVGWVPANSVGGQGLLRPLSADVRFARALTATYTIANLFL
jgi:hypothetical protein